MDRPLDEPRPGTSRKLADKDVERVLALTLESTPADATHRSTRSMAKKTGLSRVSIHRTWRAFSLSPHRSETLKLSRGPRFIENVRDIVDLYWAPPDQVLVLCVDEKSQIQALDRTAPLLPMRPGQIEGRMHDYARNGTTSLFAALDTKTGRGIGPRQRHRSVEFRSFLDTIEANVQPELDSGQLRNAQNGIDSQLAGQETAVPSALYDHFGRLAQSSRAMVRCAYSKATAARSAPLNQRTERCYFVLHQ